MGGAISLLNCLSVRPSQGGTVNTNGDRSRGFHHRVAQ